MNLASNDTFNGALPPTDIRRGLHVSKAYFFLFSGAMGTLITFLNVYLERIGLTGTQIGLIGSIAPLIALMSNPLWGGVADRWQIHRQLMAGLALVAGLISLGFLATDNFWLILLLAIGLYFFRAPVPALLDSAVMKLVELGDSSYGRQRLWGSVGFMVTAFGLGQLVAVDDLRPIFWLHAGMLAIGCAILGAQFPVYGEPARIDILAGLRTLTRQPGYASYLTGMTLLGMGLAGYSTFLGLHILKLGGNEAQIGLAWMLNAILEIPVMFLVERRFGRFRNSQLLLVGFGGYALAWFGLALAQTPLQLLLIIPAVGACYGLLWVAAVSYAAESAPEGMEATAQSLTGAAMSGLGFGIGSLVAGYVWDVADGHTVLLVAAAGMVLAGIIFWFGNRR